MTAAARTRISRPLQRILFLGAHAVAGAVLWFAAVAPILDILEAWDAALDAKSQRLMLTRAALSELTAKTAGPDEDGGSGLRAQTWAQTREDAPVAVQSRLRAAAERAGVQIRALETLPDRTEGRLLHLGFALDAAGGLTPIQSFLFDLETATPWIAVAAAQLRTASPNLNDADPGLALRIEVRVALPMFGEGPQ